MNVKIKQHEGLFNPVAHFDHIEAKELGVNPGDIAELII